LASIYASFEAPEYRRDAALLAEKIQALLGLLERPLPAGPLEAAILGLIEARDEASRLAGDMHAYAEAVYTADTRDARALAELNALEEAVIPLHRAEALLKGRLLERREAVLAALEGGLKPYRFYLLTMLEEARFQMSPEMEDLAADMSRSGGDAWGRLQGAVSSTAQALWDGATGEMKTVTALRELAHSPDRSIRERAYRAELGAWKAVEVPLAAALNGVKGAAITLDSRRGWYGEAGREGGFAAGALRKSAFQDRISEKTLNALIGTLEGSLPLFRRYLKAKARLLGLEACAFYDIFAPLSGAPGKTWTWEESSAFIADQFDRFDRRMGDFARRAFAGGWIDAESREGKIGGAYCTGFLKAGESRILCNFSGAYESVTTVAHELGHGYHHEVIKDLPPSRGAYPMTLAETASIFAETIVFEGALATGPAAENPAERRALIENNLMDSCQVTVDILSRYYFERELFERRGGGELSPAELCAMMEGAQRKTYGDALSGELHPYMWAVKIHYYNKDLSFYNYPYAFGLLFALGLYARYRKEGPAFAGAYRELLRLTGSASAEEVAAGAGFNIEDPAFWQEGMGIVARLVDEFEGMAGNPA
jgi:pepF/M3 family oligoendopeptidase